MKNLIFILQLLLLSFFAKGSIIEGRLIDSKIQSSIPYANIYLNKYSGTISDIEGKFYLSIKNYNPKDTIWISCIGYISKAILLKDLYTTGINEILLMPVVYILNPIEITTKGITPYELLLDAFKKIKENCQTGKRYYKGTYYEQIKNYDKIQQWHTRSVYSAIIIEDPGYDKLHANILDNILENIYILGINKNKDSLIKIPSREGNYLKWTLQENYYRYKCNYFSSPTAYNYKVKSTFYDSTLNTNIIEISITPKNANEDVVYGEVTMSSSDHKIFKIHILKKNEDKPIPINKKSKDYYKYLNSDIMIIYKPDFENKMILSYIKYEFGEGFFITMRINLKSYPNFLWNINPLGEIDNGENMIKKFPKMENSTNIYDQKMMNNKAFWLDYNILIKE